MGNGGRVKGSSYKTIPSYSVTIPSGAMEAIRSVLRSGWLTMGPVGESLENWWVEHTRRRYAVTVSSGQNALSLALKGLLRGREGQHVAVQANGYIGDAAAVMMAAASPFFVDVDDTMQVSLEALKDLAVHGSVDVAGIIIVHIGGYIHSRMDEIRTLCDECEWFLLEDACHAHGATQDWKPAGSWGDAAIFSFYATKVVTGGEGGIVLTDDDDVARYARLARNLGRADLVSRRPRLVSGDCRLSDILAALILAGSEELGKIHALRQAIAEIYDSALDGLNWVRPLDTGCEPSWYKYVVQLDSPDKTTFLKQELDRHGISLGGLVYRQGLYAHEVYGRRCWQNGRIAVHDSLPGTERAVRQHLCLPMYDTLGEESACYVAEAIRKAGGQE